VAELVRVPIVRPKAIHQSGFGVVRTTNVVGGEFSTYIHTRAGVVFEIYKRRETDGTRFDFVAAVTRHTGDNGRDI